jgi:hypothetical protein
MAKVKKKLTVAQQMGSGLPLALINNLLPVCYVNTFAHRISGSLVPWLSRENISLVKMRTAKKKFQLALSLMQSWIKLECCKLGTVGIMEKLRAKLPGAL